MFTATATADAVIALPSGEVDIRATYISFGLAYVLGHGAAAISKGASPLLALPGWVPMMLLGTGLAVGTVYTTRAQRGVSESDALSGKLLGASWISAFTALFLAITGLAYTLDMPDLQPMLWPTGSGLIVGLIYVSEGAVRRNLGNSSLSSDPQLRLKERHASAWSERSPRRTTDSNSCVNGMSAGDARRYANFLKHSRTRFGGARSRFATTVGTLTDAVAFISYTRSSRSTMTTSR